MNQVLNSLFFQRVTLLSLSWLVINVSAFARLGETEAQIESRFGKPLSQDHPLLQTAEGKKLMSLPPLAVPNLLLNKYKADLALAQSPFRAKAITILENKQQINEKELGGYVGVLLKKQIMDAEDVIRKLTPRVYLKNSSVIQVFFMNKGKTSISVSERYLSVDTNTSIGATKQQVPSALATKENAFKIGEFIQLGSLSYQIIEANETNIVVSGNALQNSVSEAVVNEIQKELNDTLPQLTKKEISSDRFLIIHYTIKNEELKPLVVLTDDFIIEDSKGRKFTTDAVVTNQLLQTSNKSLTLEKLQPGIARQTLQGFRLPTDSFGDALTLIIKEFGGFGNKVARVNIKASNKTSTNWQLKPISDEMYEGIRQILTDQYGNGDNLSFRIRGNQEEGRFWLDFWSYESEKKNKNFVYKIHDMVGEHGMDALGEMYLINYPKNIAEALKSAESITNASKGF